MELVVGTKFQLKLTILIFWTKFAQKACFRSKTEKMNITIELCIFELVQVTNFSLSWQFWFFEPNLPKKGVSGQKRKKWTSPIEFCMFELVQVLNFSLNWQVWFFFTKLAPKKNFRSKTENSHLCVRPWSLITILNTGADWHNGILSSLLRLVAETIIFWWFFWWRVCGDIYIYIYIYIYIVNVLNFWKFKKRFYSHFKQIFLNS